MSDSDLQLLARYAVDRDEKAFAEIVRRHINLVFSTALRRVRSPQLAEDVTQSVFADLARQSDRLADGTVLSAWLYKVAYCSAIDLVRRESRRRNREVVASQITAMDTDPPDWSQIEPLLDEALLDLNKEDRAAVVLRYFDKKSLAEIGNALGITEEAARKRTTRAVDRLRDWFGKRGVAVGTAGLVAIISANAVQAAPAGLVLSISSAVIVGSAQLGAASVTSAKIITMTFLQKSIIVAAVAGIMGGVYEGHQARILGKENQALRSESSVLRNTVEQLQKENALATNRMALLEARVARIQSDDMDLVRLRAEVARQRDQSKGLRNSKAEATSDDVGLEAKVKRLKEKLSQTPEAQIPELKYLDKFAWLHAADHKLETEDDFRAALADLDTSAQGAFVDVIREKILNQYRPANDGKFPKDISELKPYFEDPVDSGILDRYEIAEAKDYPQANISESAGGWVITRKNKVGGDLYFMGGGGVSSSDEIATLAPAMKAALEAAPAVNGRKSISTQDLEPYLATDEQKAAYQRLTHKTP